jgi:hypothetical protein
MFDEEFTPDEKIWEVIKAIKDANALAPTKDMAFVDVRKFEKIMSRTECEQIFEKLQRQYECITIGITPDYTDNFIIRLNITNKPRLDSLSDEIHNKFFSEISRLAPNNFLAVVDIFRDIMDNLQMTTANEVVIPIMPSVLRFQELMPNDSPNSINNYCELRVKAVNYLKDNGRIENFEIENAPELPRWKRKITIFVDRIKVDKFYTDLINKYDARVVVDMGQIYTETKEQKNEPIKTDEQTADNTEKPYTIVKDGVGYFKLYKEGENIKIGKENTRHFKLLQCLTEPNFGIQKTIEAVFEAIKQPQDDNDTRLSGLASPATKTRMLEIIEYTKKELQKIKKLKGKINYCMDNKKQKMWLK